MMIHFVEVGGGRNEKATSTIKLNSIYRKTTFGIANYCSLPLLTFGQALGKLQGKLVTHSEEVGWWITLMVECVTCLV